MTTSKARRTSTGGRFRRIGLAAVAATALGCTLSFGASVPAGAASSSTLLYSTDGGTTWSSTAAVAPGGTVLVRQWFDNDGAANESGASVGTDLPAGFTLGAGTTQVCLNPSTTSPASPNASELTCTASDESAVWSGGSLQVSPSAGHYGESTGSTSGTLAFGRKRYLNLQQCSYYQSSSPVGWYTSVNPTPFGSPASQFDANTDVSNTAATALSCGGPSSGYTLQPTSSGFQALDLLGNKYLNLHQCSWFQNSSPVGWYTSVNPTAAGGSALDAGTATSNTAATSLQCGPDGLGYNLVPASSGFQALDLLDNRYLNLHQCSYLQSGVSWYTSVNPTAFGTPATQFDANTGVANTADTALSCGPAASGYSFQPNSSGFQALDLLDTARGHGYVTYAMTAPEAPTPAACAAPGGVTGPEDFDQDGTFTSTPSGTIATAGTVSVDWTQLADPCGTGAIDVVSPPVLAAVAVAGLAVAGVALGRRRPVAA